MKIINEGKNSFEIKIQLAAVELGHLGHFDDSTNAQAFIFFQLDEQNLPILKFLNQMTLKKPYKIIQINSHHVTHFSENEIEDIASWVFKNKIHNLFVSDLNQVKDNIVEENAYQLMKKILERINLYVSGC